MFQRYERDMRDPLRTKEAQLKSPGSDNYSGYLMSAKSVGVQAVKNLTTRIFLFCPQLIFQRGPFTGYPKFPVFKGINNFQVLFKLFQEGGSNACFYGNLRHL